MALLSDCSGDDLLTKNFVKDMRKRPGNAEEDFVDEMEMDLSQIKLPICPAPSSIPNLNLRKGTTTLGFEYKGGVIIAVDSRASTGQYIASATTQKVIDINEYLLGTMAGGAADCQFWHRVLGQECRLWELRNKTRITVSAASKILANITYYYRHHGLSMGTMVAGWDKFGPSLYMVDDQGTRIKGKLFSVGSGCIYAYGVLDADYKYSMTDKEAQDLGRRAILMATHRDAGSGGFIQVYHLHENKNAEGKNWTRISRSDCMDIFDAAQEDDSMAKLGPKQP